MESDQATEQFNNIFEVFNLANLLQLSMALVVILLGFGLSRLAKKAVAGLTHHHLSPQQILIASRTASLVVWMITLSVALQKAGIDIGVALGAAGIFTVAIGFAAQTSVSNLISGLFLMAERPFVIGDDIQVGKTVGTVISVDLLSAKLKTPDNLLVRFPNESLLKSEITNLTRFPNRRLEIQLELPHQTDVAKATSVLLAVAAANELTLAEPAPQVFFLGLRESTLQLVLYAWSTTANFGVLKSQLLGEIQQRFLKDGIPFPAPYRNLVLGGPLEVKMVEKPPAPPPEEAPA